MGFGEGRILYLVDEMERAANQSLFVLEEPETSLHEDARQRLARYFLDVSMRKGHQIIFSTHSSEMLYSLRSESRVLLMRNIVGVTAYPNISSAQIKGLLSDGKNVDLMVCVEDAFAQEVLSRIIRKVQPMLLKALRIVAIGDGEAVRQAVRIGQQMQQKVIGVRDADEKTSEKDGLYTLPGAAAPEKEAFASKAVQDYLYRKYDCEVAGFLLTVSDPDHHHYCQHLANELSIDERVLTGEVVEAYVDGMESSAMQSLVEKIQANMS
jgi:hypothetical protein